MAPTQRELIETARLHDNAMLASDVKLNTMLRSGAGLKEPVEAPSPEELAIIEEDADPFNGNLNNRRVAERIARSPKKYANFTAPTHMGDPNKAAKDVAKSKAVNPDETLIDADVLPPIDASKLPAATPGSPAAKKAAAAAAAVPVAAPGTSGTNNPPTWKPTT